MYIYVYIKMHTIPLKKAWQSEIELVFLIFRKVLSVSEAIYSLQNVCVCIHTHKEYLIPSFIQSSY